jgi:hypothetical protein
MFANTLCAEKVEWNYAPNGYVHCTTESLHEEAKTIVSAGPDRIGPA